MRRRLLDYALRAACRITETLFPTIPDDLMAVADATGVTATPDADVPLFDRAEDAAAYVLRKVHEGEPPCLDRASIQYRAMIRNRAFDAIGPMTDDDFETWFGMEQLVADERAAAEADIDRRWFNQGGEQ